MFPNLDVDYYMQNNNIFWKRHIFIVFITTDLYIYIFSSFKNKWSRVDL